MTTFSPYTVGRVATPQVERLAADPHADPAVLRDALLGDVQVGHDLQAADQPALDVLRRVHDLVQHAVHAEPDADVASRSARCGRRRLGPPTAWVMIAVDELDDRRVLERRLDA